jgi:sec-independent protein translocase protein TatB
VFNIQGSEMIFLLLVALVILGPEKLPEAVRKFAKTYAEFKKMANGFQGEFRQALDEPMREFRETANAVRDAAKFDIDGITSPSATPEPPPRPVAQPSARSHHARHPRSFASLVSTSARPTPVARHASLAATSRRPRRVPTLPWSTTRRPRREPTLPWSTTRRRPVPPKGTPANEDALPRRS